MAFATANDLLSIEDISQYSDIDTGIELELAENAIIRLLSQVWYQKFITKNPQYTPGLLNSELLVASEWQNPVIYYALAYSILPKIEQRYGVDLRQKVAEYHERWEHGFRNLIEFGITYDPTGSTLRFIPDTEQFDYIRLRK